MVFTVNGTPPPTWPQPAPLTNTPVAAATSFKPVSPEKEAQAALLKKAEGGAVKPKAPPEGWHTQPLRLRVQHLLFIYAVAQPTFYRRMRDGFIPPPTGNDGRAWWSSLAIAQHVQRGNKPTA